MHRHVGIFILTILAIGIAWLLLPERKVLVLKPVNELRIRITSSTAIPDPARVDTAGQWYFLDHISSGLAAFDSEKKKFVPRLAESWNTRPDGTHTFRLRPDAKFHDGTPIRAKDVLWSIKRQVVLKTSTHFPFWEYIAGCEKIHSLEDDCPGLDAISDSEIAIRLKTQTDSFFLQLASPETGVWSAEDMDPKTMKLVPTKYSGPYFVAEHSEASALLQRNELSPLSQEFPDSPRRIRIVPTPLAKLDQALMSREIDLTVRSYRPFGEPDWKKQQIGYLATTPSKIIYLYGTGHSNRLPVGRDLVEALWKNVSDPGLVPGDSFLPFAERYGLTKSEFLSELPDKTNKKLRLLCPADFFSEGFLDRLRNIAARLGIELEYFFLPSKDWSKAFDDPSASEKYDFILASYAASERYPAVQLRYIGGSLTKAPIDLKPAEAPDLTDDRMTILKNYAKWLLHSRQAIPLFFTNTLFLHQMNLDLGAQPSTDAEIELWRVREKTVQ
jgi:hypothetical protein